MRFRRKTRPRVDGPQRKTQESVHRGSSHTVQPTPIATTYRERLDQKLQWVLEGGPLYWQRGPNPHQLMLFTKTLDELRDQIALEGLEPQ